MVSIHQSLQSQLVAAATVLVATTLILKRRKWNSQGSKEERRVFQEVIAQSLVGPNPQILSVEPKGIASSFSMLTTYHDGSSNDTAKLTAVIIHGFGCTSLEFKTVYKELQKRQGVSVFHYDRVLFTSSEDYQGKSRDAPTLAKELDALLKNRNLSPPYLLVGHSYGGLIAQHFASLYTHSIAGMVLIDPAHELQLQTFPKDFGSQFTTLVPCLLKAYEKLAWTGLLQRLDRWGWFNFPPIFLLASPERQACARLYSQGHVWNRTACELDGCIDTFRQMNSSPKDELRQSIQAIPTGMVIAGHRQYSPTLFPKAVTQAFLDMYQVSLPNAKVFVADQSDHWVHMQQPDVVMKAVDFVLDEWKKEQ